MQPWSYGCTRELAKHERSREAIAECNSSGGSRVFSNPPGPFASITPWLHSCNVNRTYYLLTCKQAVYRANLFRVRNFPSDNSTIHCIEANIFLIFFFCFVHKVKFCFISLSLDVIFHPILVPLSKAATQTSHVVKMKYCYSSYHKYSHQNGNREHLCPPGALIRRS